MKKIIALLLATLMVLSLVACNKNDNIITDDSDASGNATTDGGANAELLDVNSIDPSSLDYTLYFDENGFYKGIDARKYVELHDYSKIEISYYDYTVTEDEIQAEIDQIIADNMISNQVTDRAVVDGDSLNIDYDGTIDGVAFDGGSTEGQGSDVTIGVTNFIAGFLEQLIGHKPGENFDINVTFPETYGNVDLAGKDAVFNITINYITEEVEPELTDEFVAGLYSESMGWNNISEMKAGIEATLKKNKLSNAIFTYFDENSTIKEIPVIATNFWTSYMLNSAYNYSAQYGYALADFLLLMNYESQADYIAEYSTQITNNCNQSLMFQAIALDMGYTPSSDDIAAYCKEQLGIEDYQTTIDSVGREYFMNAILPNLILQKLAKENVELLSEEMSPAPTTAATETSALETAATETTATATTAEATKTANVTTTDCPSCAGGEASPE